MENLMPAAFNKCRHNGGKIRTISGPNKKLGLSERQYMHVCFLNGEMVQGEKKVKKDG
jgi:hypothetical protein